MAKKKEVLVAAEEEVLPGVIPEAEPENIDEEEVLPGVIPEAEPENIDEEGQPLDQSEPFKVGDTAFLVVGENSTKVEITYPKNENGTFECKVPAYYRGHTAKKKKTVAIHASRISATQVGSLKAVLPLSNSSIKALATAIK